MIMTRLLFGLLLVASSVAAQDRPLFDSNEPMQLVIEAPMKTLTRNVKKRPVVDGTVTYTDAAGDTVSIAVELSTRGKSRLDVCRFPPLSLSVKKKAAEGTIFEGQKSLKIVTHCQHNKRFRDNILREYGIYEAFNVLTDVSFRTRFADITYRDSEGRMDDLEEPGFFIEAIAEVAARNGLERRKVTRVDTLQREPRYATVTAMFQYMIGNTDWSAKLGPDGTNCCHNGRVLSPKNADFGWMVVPYDFDQSGVVNARYAEPDENLGIRSVRQRLWRGRCAHNDELDAVIELFNEIRAELESALQVPGLQDPEDVANYIDGFYRTINDPKRRARDIEQRCLRS